MRFLVDEDLPTAVVGLLIERGHEAQNVRSIGLAGKNDREVFNAAQSRAAVLLTADVAFGNVRTYPPAHHGGVVLLRFPDHFRRQQILDLVQAFLDATEPSNITGALVVVSPGSYRVRR
jgi:predicted nuclease of predicted toxin-antitoxin system